MRAPLGRSLASAGPGRSADAGNSENAALCQKGGWEGLVTGDGTPFDGPGACIAFGGQGGTPVEPPASAQAVCEDAGGTFTGETSTTLFVCSGWIAGSLAGYGTVSNTLVEFCVADPRWIAFRGSEFGIDSTTVFPVSVTSTCLRGLTGRSPGRASRPGDPLPPSGSASPAGCA